MERADCCAYRGKHVCIAATLQLSWSNSTCSLMADGRAMSLATDRIGCLQHRTQLNGASSLRLTSQNITGTPNWLTVEFQDSLNGYQQDSFTLYDTTILILRARKSPRSLMALGIPNYDQASRILAYNLDRAIEGNIFMSISNERESPGHPARRSNYADIFEGGASHGSHFE